MGAVYQARDLKRQSICAIKEMSLSMVPPEDQQQAIQNFKIEAKMLWGLNHPNLPAFTGFFSQGQRYFLVMEYIDGLTLEELLERNRAPFSERRVLGWARQLCDVLEYLHGQNPPIIFRDLKPGNVMLTRDGRIKLVDFGIARFFRPTSSQDTQLLGTPGFAPPEQYGRAQTDERSDIYSLAITLFQLLTNTLSETGFGLRDVRSVNPNISPTVARALEKAASLEPSDRYRSIADFRRALLGVGTFMFESGETASSARELAELCMHYPEEAADYLAAGEIESWLKEIGDQDLARLVRQLRTQIADPRQGIERFVEEVVGQVAPLHHVPATTVQPSRKGGSRAGVAVSQPASRGSRGSRNGMFVRKPSSLVQVSPSVLDFGAVYTGDISTPLIITITGGQGVNISGGVYSNEPWIVLDQSRFDVVQSQINVHIDSTQLSEEGHYNGTILVAPDTNGTAQRIISVAVEVDIISYTNLQPTVFRHPHKTVGADLDEVDDYDSYNDENDDLAVDTLTQVAPITSGKVPIVRPNKNSSSTSSRIPAYRPGKQQVQRQVQASNPADQYEEDEDTETQEETDTVVPDTGASSADRWQQRGLTFSCAFMLASLLYTLIEYMPWLKVAPLPPNPWFIVLLAGFVPLASAGALLVRWRRNWPATRTLDYVCTSLTSSLLLLSVVEVLWQLLVHMHLPALQLVIMLVAASLGATIGLENIVNKYILRAIEWALSIFQSALMLLAILVGGALGYALTIAFSLSCFTPFGIVIGIGVAVALVWHVEQAKKTSAR